MQYTDEQREIIQEALTLYSNGGNGETPILKVTALAGTGKTTTMLAVAEALVKEAGAEKVLYVIFNNHMRAELETKVRKMGLRQIYPKTFNSVAFWLAARNGFKHIHSAYSYAYNYQEFREYQNFCRFYKDGENRIYKELLENKELDFSGELRFLAEHASWLKYDVIIMDEAQDTNPCMLAFFQKAQAKLKIMVGDANQSIYLFNGAVNAMWRIKTEHNKYLTTSFRTRDEKVQELVNRVLKHIYPKNPTYRIHSTQKVQGNTTVYLTRTNAAAIRWLKDFVEDEEEDKKVSVGINVTKEMKDTMEDLLLLMEEDHSRKLPGITLKDVKEAVGRMFDELFDEEEGESKDNLLYEYALLYSLASGERSRLEELQDLIELYEVDPSKLNSVDIYITTAHRFKGLEAPYIYVDVDSFESVLKRYREALESTPDNRVKKVIRDYLRQEYNLFYIALTRAINGVENLSNVEVYVEEVLGC